MSEASPRDGAARRAAVAERARTVIVEGRAGTGKTSLLIDRLLHQVVPEDDGRALTLERMAIVTCEPAAADALRQRLGERLATEAARTDLSPQRASRLARAIAALPGAWIGSAHGLAARLLRAHAADARLCPAYELLEDSRDLIEETHGWLCAAAEQGTLASLLRGSEAAALAAEAVETVRLLQSIGLDGWAWAGVGAGGEPGTSERGREPGFAAFVAAVIGTRECELSPPTPRVPDLIAVRRHADELARTTRDLHGDGPGARALRRLTKLALQIAAAKDTTEALRRGLAWQRMLARARRHFGRTGAAASLRSHAPARASTSLRSHAPARASTEAEREVWRWLDAGARGQGAGAQQRAGGPLALELSAPLASWLAERLVRIRPVILWRYAELKRERRLVDRLDVLRALRDLLQRDLGARAALQARFEHLLIDDAQELTALESEIVLYLCEQGTRARRAADVKAAPGKLTLSADPAPGRAAQASNPYAELCSRLPRESTYELQLTTDRRRAGGQALCVLPSGSAELTARDARAFEAETLARHLRRLVEAGDTRVIDPRTGLQRPARYGDIAILTGAAASLAPLPSALDEAGVPYQVHGGLPLALDPLLEQFVLALCALSDRGDEAAQAALFRPPFFALDADEATREASGRDISGARRESEEVVAMLRRVRHELPPGEAARRVIEETGFGRHVAAGANGAERLARLYELCGMLERRAQSAGLDFDGVTALARGWLLGTTGRVATALAEADAVQLIAPEEARGREWPIVALWGARARLAPEVAAFTIDGANGTWAVALAGFRYISHGRASARSDDARHDRASAQWDDTGERRSRKIAAVARREQRERLAYLAATRARDLLIVPESGTARAHTFVATVLRACADRPLFRASIHEGSEGAGSPRIAPDLARSAPRLRSEIEASWRAAARAARRPQLGPATCAFSSHAHVCGARPSGENGSEHAGTDSGRYGTTFAVVVQRALELLLTKRAGNPDGATRQAAREQGLEEHAAMALADVNRALSALEAAGLTTQPLHLAYPVAGALDATTLLAGAIDLLVASEHALVAIDIHTDAPPGHDVRASHARSVQRLSEHARLLERSGLADGRAVRAGLLFTADGGLRWI